MKYLLLTICIALCIACNNDSPDGYVTNFDDFVKDVKANAPNYTAEDWKNADAKFAEYTETKYNEQQGQLSEEQLKELGRIKGQYFAIRAKYYVKDFLDELNDATNEAKGFIEGMTEELKDSSNQ